MKLKSVLLKKKISRDIPFILRLRPRGDSRTLYQKFPVRIGSTVQITFEQWEGDILPKIEIFNSMGKLQGTYTPENQGDEGVYEIQINDQVRWRMMLTVKDRNTTFILDFGITNAPG